MTAARSVVGAEVEASWSAVPRAPHLTHRTTVRLRPGADPARAADIGWRPLFPHPDFPLSATELRADMEQEHERAAAAEVGTIALVTGWIAEAENITVLTGAGVSTDSGVPDFRGPKGVWTLDPAAQRMFDIDSYVAHAQVRQQAWRNRRDHPAWTAAPNPAHHALVGLEKDGRLQALLTQNIDGLHQRAGSSPDLVIELHGTLFGVECLGCGAATSMEEALERVAAGDPDPRCLRCGGILKAATVSFGQQLKPEVLRAAAGAAAGCDLFLAVGTSLRVQPAAALCEVAVGAGARFVVVNAEPTPYDPYADALLREPIGDVLPRLLAG